MTARRIKSLHFNLEEGKNVPFHREHRSKKGRKKFYDPSLAFRRMKLKKKYGNNWKLFKI
jgi:hypothetical protein